MKFLKIQAAGNDYLYVSGDTPLSDLPSLPEKYCDRRFGVGADGIIRVEKISDGLLSMRIFNADGSEGKTCGNGIRSSAVFAHLTSMINSNEVRIKTLSATHTVRFSFLGENRYYSVADFPMPSPDENADTLIEILQKSGLYVDKRNFFTINNGNIHAVVLNGKHSAREYFEVIKNAKIYDGGANVEVVKKSGDEILCEVCERGSLMTLSCGSGAVAVAFALKNSLFPRRNEYDIKMKGGVLTVKFEEEKAFLGGLVTPVFYGDTDATKRLNFKQIPF